VRTLTGRSLTRATAALAIVGVASVFSVAACGIVGGGSDDVQDTATGTHAAVTPAPTTTAPPVTAPAAVPTDAATITALARTVVLADKVGDICREKLSAKFVMTVFKTVQRCERNWDSGDDKDQSDDATGVTVSNVRVSGVAGTATVTELYPSGNVTGTWAFFRVGKSWRVAAWGTDYLRSGFRNMFGPGYRSEGAEDPLGYPVVRTCLSGKLDRLSDADMDTFGYGMFRADKAVVQQLQRDVMTCARVRDAEGVTTLRRLFEVGLRKGMKPGSEAAFTCVTQRLRKTITDDQILAGSEAWQKTGVYPPDMVRAAGRAGYDCAGEAAKASPTRSA
jgi:hypothetical protein